MRPLIVTVEEEEPAYYDCRPENVRVTLGCHGIVTQWVTSYQPQLADTRSLALTW